MGHRSHHGYLGFAMVLGAIGVGLVACSIPGDSEPPRCNPEIAGCPEDNGVGGSGGGTFQTTAGSGGEGSGPGLTGGGGAGSAGGDGAGYVDGGVGDGGSVDPLAIPASCMGIDQVQRTFYMSADDSNSMGSPAHVRELINIGFEPNPARIRTYEFLNYYRIAYPVPAYGSLNLFPDMEQKAENPHVAEFQLGVRSFDALVPRRPMNLTFLIDTSGSMKGPGITRAKAAVKAISSMLVPGDIVSMVASDMAIEKLDGYVVTGPEDPMLLAHLDKLTTGGNSDLYTALGGAYKIAKDHANESLMNRVIMISDGGVNAGVTETMLIAQESADADKEGIYLIGIGTGPAVSYNDKLMNDVTDAGRGAYVYLDSVEEAQRIFTERFDETMDIAARSVQVEVSLPWYFRVKGISTEEISEMPVTAQHLAPNDAMVFNLEVTACDPSMYAQTDNVRIRVFWKTRVGYLDQVTEMNIPLDKLLKPGAPAMAKGRAIVAYAEALKGCGFKSNGSSLCDTEAERKKATKEKLLKARELAVLANQGGDLELEEIMSLIDKHPLIMKGL